MTIDDVKLMDSFYELDENNKINKEYKLKSKKKVMEKQEVKNAFFIEFYKN